MAERDAFGNEIEPTPTGEPVAARPAPAADASPVSGWAPTPDAPREATASGLRVVPRVLGGCVSFLAIALFVGGCAIAALVRTVDEGVDTFRSISTSLSVPAPPPVTPGLPDPDADPGRGAAPAGLARGSLLRRAAFSRAVTRLRGAGLGRPRSLRVAADRIDAQLVTATGRLRSVQVVPGGELRTLATTASGGFAGGDLLSLAGIDRGAPERLARAAAGRARVPATRIDYLVLSAAGDPPRWLAFVRDGPAYLADRSGRIERKVR